MLNRNSVADVAVGVNSSFFFIFFQGTEFSSNQWIYVQMLRMSKLYSIVQLILELFGRAQMIKVDELIS